MSDIDSEGIQPDETIVADPGIDPSSTPEPSGEDPYARFSEVGLDLKAEDPEELAQAREFYKTYGNTKLLTEADVTAQAKGQLQQLMSSEEGRSALLQILQAQNPKQTDQSDPIAYAKSLEGKIGVLAQTIQTLQQNMTQSESHSKARQQVDGILGTFRDAVAKTPGASAVPKAFMEKAFMLALGSGVPLTSQRDIFKWVKSQNAEWRASIAGMRPKPKSPPPSGSSTAFANPKNLEGDALVDALSEQLGLAD